MESKNEMKIEKNPFSFQKLDENLARLEKLFGKPKPEKQIVYIKGANRILVKDEDSQINYMTPSWFSEKGNLCWNINGTIFFKTKGGYIGKRVNEKWQKANFSTKAKALGGK